MNLWKLPAIVIAPDAIFPIGGFWVTNTLLCTWITILVLIVILYFGTRRREMIPSGAQNAVEWAVEFLQGLVIIVAGKEKGKKFFPLVATFFLFIALANLLDVIPGVDTVGTISQSLTHPATLGFLLTNYADSNKITPWIRPASTDLNLNLAMALVSVVTTQFFGFTFLGFKDQLSKYLNFRAVVQRGPMGIVDFFVGLLEIVSELGRLISFSFRLFGNIFAGSVLLAVFAFLVPALANVVFIPFEIFVAIIQAFVFSFLTLIFMEVGTTSHAHGEHDATEIAHEGDEPIALTASAH